MNKNTFLCFSLGKLLPHWREACSARPRTGRPQEVPKSGSMSMDGHYAGSPRQASKPKGEQKREGTLLCFFLLVSKERRIKRIFLNANYRVARVMR